MELRKDPVGEALRLGPALSRELLCVRVVGASCWPRFMHLWSCKQATACSITRALLLEAARTRAAGNVDNL